MTASVWSLRLLTTALVLNACGSSAGLTAVDADGDWLPLFIVSDLRQPDSTQTAVTIDAASISGDTLQLRLSYAGGCGGPHEFGLAVDRALSAADPPQVTVALHHNGHGDACRAGYGWNVNADLRALQTIAQGNRTLRLQLYEPWSATPVEVLLVYSF
jgi:hypothetical protein